MERGNHSHMTRLPEAVRESPLPHRGQPRTPSQGGEEGGREKGGRREGGC